MPGRAERGELKEVQLSRERAAVPRPEWLAAGQRRQPGISEPAVCSSWVHSPERWKVYKKVHHVRPDEDRALGAGEGWTLASRLWWTVIVLRAPSGRTR